MTTPSLNKKDRIQQNLGGLKLSPTSEIKRVYKEVAEVVEPSYLPVGTQATSVDLTHVIEERGSRRDPVVSDFQAKTGSNDDSVTTRQSHQVTVSPDDGVTTGQSEQATESGDDGVSARQGSSITELHDDRVTARQCHAVTVSREYERRKFRQHIKPGALKPVDHYCAVPGILLRDAGLFESTFDFMVYMHLFSKSYGFGRNTCDMGLNELITFTGLARNSVKKSLDSLTKTKWIRMISNFEYGRITRKWRVYTPHEIGHSPHPTFREVSDAESTVTTGSHGDSVTAEHCQSVPVTGSRADSVTESRSDPYKESIQRNSKEIFLSKGPATIRDYLDQIKPERKRESEWQAFEELRAAFADQDIADCFTEVTTNGIPGSERREPCHSPMAYLAMAMGEVLEKVITRREQERKKQEMAVKAKQAAKQSALEEAQSLREWEERQEAFRRALAGRDETSIVNEICRRHNFALTGGHFARIFAIGKWAEEQVATATRRNAG